MYHDWDPTLVPRALPAFDRETARRIGLLHRGRCEGHRLGVAVYGAPDEAERVTMEPAWSGDGMTERIVPVPRRDDHAHWGGGLEDILESVCVRPAAPVPGSV
jgi:hypothetical protein